MAKGERHGAVFLGYLLISQKLHASACKSDTEDSLIYRVAFIAGSRRICFSDIASPVNNAFQPIFSSLIFTLSRIAAIGPCQQQKAKSEEDAD
ncbi:hypothetical protein I6G66_20090 [Delftia acidovorans]|uniref:Uncharacterized protein n=1 Tax=Delftia acidovorans TaxID=80866 RepID=A0A7T2VX62_DELAC|nr:hypothetical protein [Delftia acidovorans]QPS06596.1 hypothetical protein I6G66_20090 [Delftia acidovorans]